MHTIEFDAHTEQALSRLAAIAERHGLTVCTLDRGMTAAALALGLRCETLQTPTGAGHRSGVYR